MKRTCRIAVLLVPFLAVLHVPKAAAADWAPVTDQEKNLKSNPLDPGSGAVVLFKRGEVHLQENNGQFWSTGRITYTRIKILNDAGRKYADVSVDSSSDLRLGKVEGRTILPSGQIIPLDPSQVFRGRALSAGRDLALVKTSFTFPSVEPGAIIEYQVEEFEDSYFPPSWIFDTPELATLQSSLKLVVASRLIMRVFPLQTTTTRISAAMNRIADGYQYDFAAQNIRPIREEPYDLPFRDQAAMVMFTPYAQSFANMVFPIIQKWDDVANLYSEWLTAMDKVDVETSKQAKELTQNLPEGRPRAEAIYKYLQQNMTSSNLASFILARNVDAILAAKRGDPADINFLFVIMLKHAKLDANLVLVGGRDYQTPVKDFPNFYQFSRIITRVNFKDGPVFVDASLPTVPFGELPWYEKGQTVMVVKGGKMQDVDIPYGAPDDNLSVTKVSVQVTPDWQAKGEAQVEMKGSEAIQFRRDLMGESPAKIDERLTDYFTYGHRDGLASNITHPDFHDASQPFVLKAEVQDKLLDSSGPGELLLNPWLDDRYASPIFKASERHSAVRFENPEKRISTSTWQLAPEIQVAQLPKDVSVDNDLGSFSHSCAQTGSTVTCTRTFVLKKTDLPSTLEYQNARKFFDEITKDDQEVIVLHGK